jgi:DNA repair protein RAD50
LIGPLKTKVRAKETERARVRSAGNNEERILQTQLSQFDNDVKQLRALVDQIDVYYNSSKSDELERLTSTIAKIAGNIQSRKQRVDSIQPELEAVRSAVLDQERHKKNLKQNIDILESKSRMAELEKEVLTLEKDLGKIQGRETVYDDYAKATKMQEKLKQDQARLDGRFSEIVESLRSLKRKLSQQEYKNVDEEYRIATINHTTTLIAAEDLKKFDKVS